ncbi:sugar phosphate isomerase/epimerase [Candidatus Woesearchaeota archaeon]|nr:sugar phosphate isomerase/epimerase [Candidatus Woesearchaeota archaeon]
MVHFGSGYHHSMDREYGASTPADNATNDIGVGIKDFGMSMGLGPVPNVQAIGAKLRAGGRKLEFVFTGSGKGSGQGQTPEMYGKLQRQALVEMKQANRVDFTTHATIGVYGLAGMDQQGNFSKSSKNFSVQEIKRAIEFASDVARGGPIVVHTGEFQRPIADAEWNEEGPWAKKFQMYTGEEDRTSYRVVDQRTGGVIQEARKNRKVSRPVWKKYESGDEFWDQNGGKEYTDKKGNTVQPGDYIDYWGNKLEPDNRAPVFNRKTGEFKIQQMGWEELKKEAEELTQRARKYWQENKSKGEEVWNTSLWKRFKEVKSAEDIQIKPEEAYIIATLETTAANSRGWALQYAGDFDEYVDKIKKLEKAQELYKKIYEATSEEERWKLKVQLDRSGLGKLVPEDEKYPHELIERSIAEVRRHIKQAQEASSSQWSQASEAMETIRNVESAETYAFKEACEAYAQSAIKAMMESDKLEKEKKLSKPLTIAMENLFPETYGAHPDELIKLVKGSQDTMIAMLKKRGMDEEQARKEAGEHITATFDTGHFNMWRKYWKGDPGKSMAQNDEEFNRWMLTKLGEMVDKGIIGHVHIDDNYGYHDDHLAPGEGNTPIREMVKLLKEKKYKGELIVEPGADYTTDVSGFSSVMKTWRLFGSPVYGTGSAGTPAHRSWGQVQYGFFGQNQPPYFVFAPYTPSEDWTLWSGVPLE